MNGRSRFRIYLPDELVEVARNEPDNPALKPLADILARHHATMLCQFDAFASYVAEAERQGVEGCPLYAWTKATIEDPAKKAKHLKSFALHVNGQEVYSKAEADALEADLQPLVGGKLIERPVEARHQTRPTTRSRPNAFASRRSHELQ